MNSTDRVGVYLDDVARMLTSIDPADRAEILAGLREHVDAALGALPHPAGPDDVERVLAELGAADRVAAAALTDLGHPPSAPLVRARPPVLDRGWLPVLVATLLLIGVVVALLVVASAGSFVVTTTESVGPDGSVVPGPEIAETDGLVGAGVGALVLTTPLWLAAAVLLMVSRLFPTRLKVAGALLVPAVAVVPPLAAAAAIDAFGPGAAAPTSVPVLVLALAATALVVRALLRAGRAGAGEIAAERPLLPGGPGVPAGGS